MSTTTPRLLYVTDALCGWCYGFAPVVERLRQHYADVPLDVLNGGLAPGDRARTPDASFLGYLRQATPRLTEMTGQSFGDGFWERLQADDFVYDTEPAARAVTAVRHLAPEHVVPYLHAVQHAFYVEGADPTDPEVLADVAEEQELDRDAFLDAYDDEQSREATWAEFEMTQRFGVRGFPALLYQRPSGQWLQVASGYTPFEKLQPVLDRVLAEDRPQPIAVADVSGDAGDAACGPDGCAI